eukprot:scaffold7228_cov523-Prasinococcus_capsulatus_cf.AAC.6
MCGTHVAVGRRCAACGIPDLEIGIQPPTRRLLAARAAGRGATPPRCACLLNSVGGGWRMRRHSCTPA